VSVAERTTSSCGVPLDPHAPIPPEVWDRLRERWPDGARLRKVFLLAPTVDVAEALLRGESVPEVVLDPDGVRRLGLRP
jgi:hypothetical protein